jgi:hypothetical protein
MATNLSRNAAKSPNVDLLPTRAVGLKMVVPELAVDT